MIPGITDRTLGGTFFQIDINFETTGGTELQSDQNTGQLALQLAPMHGLQRLSRR